MGIWENRWKEDQIGKSLWKPGMEYVICRTKESGGFNKGREQTTWSDWHFREISQATEGKVDQSEQRQVGRLIKSLLVWVKRL